MKNIKYYIVITLGLLVLSGCSKPTVQENLQKASNSFELKKYSVARVQAKQILKYNPENIEARILLAKTYQIEGSFTNAEKEWGKTIKHNIDMNMISTNYLQALYALNDTLTIVEFWKQNRNSLTDANKADAAIIVSLALLEVESIEKSRLLIDKSIQWAQKSNNNEAKVIASALQTAFSTTKTKQQQIASLAEACTEYQNYWIICTLSVNTQIADNQLEEATKTLEHLVSILPLHYRSMIILAETYIKLNNTEKASTYLNHLLKLFPKQAYINQLMAMYSLQNANFEKANIHINATLTQGLNTSQTKLIAGLTNYQLENYEQALSFFNGLKSDFPNNNYITKMLVATQLKLGNHNAVYNELSGIKLTKANTKMLAMASLELLKAGANKQSLQLLKKVDTNSIIDKNLLTSISLAKIASGDSSSIDDIEKIVQNIMSDESLSEKDINQSKYLLISSFLSTNQIPRAVNQVETWINESPKSIENYLLQAEIQKRVKVPNTDTISNIYQLVLKIDIDNVPANLFLASTAYQNENYEQANKYFKNIITKNKFNIKALQGYYLTSKQLDQELQALKEVENLLLIDSKEPRNRLMLAQFFLVSQKYNKAIKLLSTYKFTINENINTANLILGDAFLSIKQYKKAIHLYDLLLLNKVLNYNVLSKKLYAHEKINHLLPAIADLKRLNIIHPNNTAILLSLANLQVLINQPLEALSNIEKLKIEHPLINSIKGSALHRALRYKEALPYLEIAYQTQPQPQISGMIFESLIATGEKIQAMKHMKKHLDNFPNDSKNRSLYAANIAKTDRKSAINEYVKVIEKEKRNIIVLNNLAWHLYKDNQFKRAEFYIEKAKKLAPNSANIDDTYQKIKSAIKKNK